MNLSSGEHRDRPRLDRRLPRGARALPELAHRAALRQLRRHELPRLRRPRPDELYARLATAPSRRRRRSRRPATSSRSTRSCCRSYERILSLQLSSTLSGTYASAVAAAESAGDAVRVIDTRTVAAAIAMLALAVQRRLERGHDRRGDRRARRALPRRSTACSSRRHARVPRPRRPDRPRGRPSRARC